MIRRTHLMPCHTPLPPYSQLEDAIISPRLLITVILRTLRGYEKDGTGAACCNQRDRGVKHRVVEMMKQLRRRDDGVVTGC
jgi:hypothetical protein